MEELFSNPVGPSPEEIQGLKAAHGATLIEVDLDGVIFVIRPLNRLEFKRYQADMANPKQLDDAHENAVITATVWPSTDEVRDRLERMPACVMQLADEIVTASGMAEKKTTRRL